ncbi:ATP-binding protein [Desulforhopalus sp. 52FAK]
MINRDTYFNTSVLIPWMTMRYRITAGIMFILCILFLFFAKIAITEQRARMLQQIENYGAESSRFMAQISIIPLQKFSIYQLENYVAHFEKSTLIAYCKIYDNKGLLLTPGGGMEAGVGGKNDEQLPSIKIFESEITENGVYYGRVEVALYLDSVNSQIDSISMYIMAAFLLGLVVIGGAVSYFIHSQFVRPMQKLSKTTKTIAEGHFVTSDISHRRDEIGQLAESINLMSSSLEDSYRTLEKKVDERTAELYHAKNMAEKSNRHLQIVGEEVQALLDNSPVGILFVTDDYNILRVNEEFYRITGYKSEEIVGKSTRILYPNVASFKDFAKISEHLDNNDLFEKRTELVTKDGSLISCAVRGRKTFLAGGAKGIVLNFEDISSRLLIEEELLKIKKLESVRVLARGIAHDFNNMLVAILGNLSLIQRFTESDEKVGGLVEEARKASMRAKDLTEKLLTFAKGSEPDSKVEHLSTFLQKHIPVFLLGSSIECDFDLEDGLWKVKMDKSQIDTVLQNIVQNAKEAMAGVGELKVSCSNKEIGDNEISTLAAGKYVKITISDTGSGVDGKIIDKVFDPYFSTKEKDSNKGSGLGLSIVRSIMIKHKGAVSIESKLGQGSTVTVFLPAVETEPAAEKVPEEILPTGKGHVVVVDEHQDTHDQAMEMLPYLGWEYVGCYSLKEATTKVEELVTEENSRVIVLVSMTDETEASRVVEMFQRLSVDIKLVACHGGNEDAIVKGYVRDGFNSDLPKPFQLLDLSRVLSAINR